MESYDSLDFKSTRIGTAVSGGLLTPCLGCFAVSLPASLIWMTGLFIYYYATGPEMGGDQAGGPMYAFIGMAVASGVIALVNALILCPLLLVVFRSNHTWIWYVLHAVLLACAIAAYAAWSTDTDGYWQLLVLVVPPIYIGLIGALLTAGDA